MYRSCGSWVTGSPLTMAKGISTCSGGGSACAAGGGALDTTIFSSGLRFMRFVPLTDRHPCLVGAQVHRAPHLLHCLTGRIARLVGAFRNDTAHQLRIVLELLRPAAHARNLLHDLIDDRLLAVETADARRPAALVDPLAGAVVRVDLVQIPDGALLRVARIGAAHARGISLHRPQFLHDRLWLLAQADGVAVRLRRLAPVETRDVGRRGQQRLWLGKDRDPRALEKSEQPLAIGHSNAIVAVDQRPCTLQRLGVAGLLELAA